MAEIISVPTDTVGNGGFAGDGGFGSSFIPDAPTLIAKILAKRGLDDASYAEFEKASECELRDVRTFVRMLHESKVLGHRVAIMPDFDMDGIMSGVLGYAGLCELGFSVVLNIPKPERGYGISVVDVDELLQANPDVGTIVTCDTGISCLAGAKRAKECGCRFLVTDHHREDRATSVRGIADVVVDPCRTDDSYPMKEICGAHVFWQCLRLYAQTYRPDKVENIDRLRVFAGIGTVSDMMSLAHENRQLVRDAVSISRLLLELGDVYIDMLECCSEYRQVYRGLACVICLMEAHGKIRGRDGLDEQTFGFYMAPMFNAVKRLGYDMHLAFDIFCVPLADRKLGELCEKLWNLNEARKREVSAKIASILSSADAGRQVLAPYVYVVNEDVTAGIVGLIANSLLARTGMPTLVVRACSDGSYHGSGRSPSWYPFLTRTSQLDMFAAGHEGAFGVGFDDVRRLKSFYDFFVTDVAEQHDEYEKLVASGEIVERPFYDILIDENDGDVGFDTEVLQNLVSELERYRPFGEGFPEPRFCLSFDVWNRSEVRGMKPDGRGGFAHGKFMLPCGITGLCFNQGDSVMSAAFGHHDVVGALEINSYAGRDTVQVRGTLDPVELSRKTR